MAHSRGKDVTGYKTPIQCGSEALFHMIFDTTFFPRSFVAHTSGNSTLIQTLCTIIINSESHIFLLKKPNTALKLSSIFQLSQAIDCPLHFVAMIGAVLTFALTFFASDLMVQNDILSDLGHLKFFEQARFALSITIVYIRRII